MKNIVLFVLMSLFTACGADYVSGKTKCSVDGDCPGGFVCTLNGMCTASAEVCKASSSANACARCAVTSCCQEMYDCELDTACSALLSCISNCTASTCYTNCENLHSTGLSLYVKLSLCLSDQCNTSCQ
jgi:hypothetical protein